MESRSKSVALFLLTVGFLHAEAISTRNFYPFGTSNGDRKLEPNDDGSSGKIGLSVSFPFFEERYNSLYVNTNGVISFIDTLEEFTPDAFPVRNGRRLIAPFWADVDTRNGGDVFYRESKDLELLQRASNDIKKHFYRRFNEFRASWVFIATWYNVSHFIKQRSILRGRVDPSRNTFQAILSTNGRHTFAIFLYNKTEWTTGDASKGMDGQGGIAAQAGFNYGDGIRYYSISGSRTRLVKQFPSSSNVGVNGMFIFRIDEARITNGGCNTEGGLAISPRQGLVLGGTRISVSGPCFQSKDLIVCRFDGKLVTEGNYVDKYRVSCVSPPLHRIGRISLEVSVDNGTTFPFSTVFNSVALGRHGPDVSGLVAKDWVSHIDPLYLAWDPNHLSTWKVHIEVAKFDWNTLEMLDENIIVKENVSNFGFHLVRDLVKTALPMPSNSKKYSKNYTTPLAVVTIRADTPRRGPPARIYSAPFLTIPMKGNISQELVDAYNELRIPTQCKEWFAEDDFDEDDIFDELIGCPTSLEQAEADSGRFASDDVCKPPRTTSCQVYHNGSYHCFRSTFPSPSGAGQQCCYNKKGQLVVGPSGGGTVDRYHPKSSRYATLRHLKEDIYPWYLCCRLCNKCGLYYQNRPSDNGTRYNAPQIATTFGDPHFITLDGLPYTFNGHGEYTMLNIEENGFTFQARMQALELRNGKSRGTFLMAFVLRDSKSDTIQIELNSLKLLDVFVNGEEETFEPRVPVLEFEGFLLEHGNDSVIKIIFKSGIVVNVKQNDLSLSFDMLLPDTFKGKTKGLLGVWDDNKNNDFTLPDGHRIDTTSNASDIHFKFGQKWLVDANKSLFLYHNGKKHKDFVDKTYQPMYVDEKAVKFDDKLVERKALELCEGVKECLFDIAVSGRLNFGNSTKLALEEFNEKKKRINTVRVPVYFNCDANRVMEPCDACGSMCMKTTSNTVAVVLAVLFCVVAAIVAALVVFRFWRKKKPQEKQVATEQKNEQTREIPQSEPTAMAFVLPAFPESRKITKIYS